MRTIQMSQNNFGSAAGGFLSRGMGVLFRRRTGAVAAGLVLLLGVVVTACGADAASEQPEATRAPAVQSVDHKLPLDFAISVYQGESVLGGTDVQFSDILAPGKPVVLNMWAGLCPSCRLEMPDFQTVYEEVGDDIVLFGLDIGPFTGLGDREDALALIAEIGVTFPVGSTDRAEVVSAYRVLAMPSTYFIRPDGSIFESWSGPLVASDLREKVAALLADAANEPSG